MYRIVVPVISVFLLLDGAASAQEWARTMFSQTSHDFGTVARGAKSEFSFELTNKYKEDIHISSVRASCGCATPTISKHDLKTWEKGTVDVRFNTGSFRGQRSATITVVIDRPYFAEVQLSIRGYIRTDVVVDPGGVVFDSVEQGKQTERNIRVQYAGHNQWQLKDVRSANPNLQVKILNQKRTANHVVYDLAVSFQADTQPGYFKDQMLLVTSDEAASNIPVIIEGNVEPLLTVSPASLFLGVVQPGETVTKQLVVRAKEPFRITNVKCDDDHFEFNPTDEMKRLHLVPVKFTAQTESGELVRRIEIETDRGPTVVGNCTATAKIRDQDEVGAE